MATATPSFESLRRDIAARQLAPVYLLHGEEGYYIDALVAEFLKVIPEEDKDFCERVLYAPESEPGYVMDVCRHLPMMAERQMVILKECQEVNATIINKLHSYVEHPTASTTLVICFRGAEAKGKDAKSRAEAAIAQATGAAPVPANVDPETGEIKPEQAQASENGQKKSNSKK